MANDNLEQIVAARVGDVGDHTRDEVLRQEILREVIYTETDSMSVGTTVLGTTQMDRLGVEFTWPEHTTAEYPVAQDTVADRQRIVWSDFKIRLRRGQTHYHIADSAKLEGVEDLQANRMRQRASEALSRRKDENILCTLADGAWSENDTSAATAWNDDSATDNPIIDDLFEMWQQIIIAAPVQSLDTRNMTVILPAEVYSEVHKLELINNLQQRVEDYLGQAFGFSIYGHKLGLPSDVAPLHVDDQSVEQYGVDMRDKAIMLLPGSDTAIHGELSASAAASAGVPLVEEDRDFGQGDSYLITQWFDTAIMEHENDEDGKTPRIAVKDGVNAEAA